MTRYRKEIANLNKMNIFNMIDILKNLTPKDLLPLI